MADPGLEGPSASETPDGPGNSGHGPRSRFDWANNLVIISTIVALAAFLWWAIDNVDDDVDRLVERVNLIDGTVKGSAADIGSIKNDVDQLKDKVQGLAADVNFIRGRLATPTSGKTAGSASPLHTGMLPAKASPR